VGSDEESSNKDLAAYLQSHKPPDLTLVLDSEFPVVVGEKAWDALELTAEQPYQVKRASAAAWSLLEVRAGIAASIVPPLATARLKWLPPERAGFESALNALCPAPLPADYRCEAQSEAGEAVMTVFGRAAHSGMNIQGGRNALVLLANALNGKLAPSPAADLLDFAVLAGRDLTGTGLGLTQRDPLWGQYSVNVAKIEPAGGGKLKLTINLRRIPPFTHEQIKQHLVRIVSDFNRRQESTLEMGGYFQDEPFTVPPDAKLVRKLLAIYERATGERAGPAIAGGATYAKRLPNAVAFGMWFPGQPYTGHDVNERISIQDLHRGVGVLLAALEHLAFGEPLRDPLQP
jgi:acetylornithine deacetylase/succinyl-diaminopimelate desuccinylase-like protein